MQLMLPRPLGSMAEPVSLSRVWRIDAAVPWRQAAYQACANSQLLFVKQALQQHEHRDQSLGKGPG